MIAYCGPDSVGETQNSRHLEWRRDGSSIHYVVRDDEYLHETDRAVLLADIVLDKSKSTLFHEQAEKLLEGYFSGSIQADLFRGGYFIVIIDKIQKRIVIARDPSGIKSGYYSTKGNSLWIGTLVHEVAKRTSVSSFDREAIFQFLHLDYFMDGYTYYQGVNETKMGQTLVFGPEAELLSYAENPLKLSDRDNGLSPEENIHSLRRKIVEAHRAVASGDNVVMLSGGIDSAVIATSLLETGTERLIRSVSFRVRGTSQDETPYAGEIADHLGIENNIIEVDPNDPERFRDFDDTILAMNNPYIGVWIYGKFDRPSPTTTFFAGQDTRLHTPDVNVIDKIAFSLLPLRRKSISRIILAAIHACLVRIGLLRLRNASSRYARGVARLLNIFDIRSYIERYFFKLDKDKIKAQGLPLAVYHQLAGMFAIDFNAIRNTRQLYNEIVKLKWGEQYTSDIRYLQDMARLNGTYVAMPFYDARLAVSSSSIPFKEASKVIIGRDRFSGNKLPVNKYVLRSAFRDRLTDSIYYRRKAVSNTFHLLFNGALGTAVRERITADLHSEPSFIRAYGLEEFVDRFLTSDKWQIGDDNYLLKMYYISALCVYDKNVLQSSQQAPGDSTSDYHDIEVASCQTCLL